MVRALALPAFLALALGGCSELGGFAQRELDITLDCDNGECECAERFSDCDGDLSNGCEDTASNVDHCGACGVRCGGECREGQCFPLTVVDINDIDGIPASFAIAGDTAVAGTCGRGLFVVELASATPTTIDYPGCIERVVSDAGRYYFFSYTSDEVELRTGTVSGGEPQLVRTASWDTYVTALRLADQLFWVEDVWGDLGRLSTVQRASRDATIVESLDEAASDEQLNGLQVAQGRAFWRRSIDPVLSVEAYVGRLVSAAVDGPPQQTIVFSDERFDGPFAVNDTHAYWASSDGRFYRTLIADGKTQKLAIESSAAGAVDMALDDEHLYWIDAAASSVLRAPLDGGPSEALATDQHVATYLTIAGDFVYWSNRDAVVRVRR